MSLPPVEVGEGAPSLLLIDDDLTFLAVLSRALARHGFRVSTANSVQAALALLQTSVPDYAVVDLKLPGESGLDAVTELRRLRASMQILVLTGYASIATAVEAVKRGATNYLAKPADAAEIVSALRGADPARPVEAPVQPMSIHRLEWEHLQRVLHAHGGNITKAARALKLHRRSLQRKLAKRPSPAADSTEP